MAKYFMNIFSCDHIDKFITTNLCQDRNTIIFGQNSQLEISFWWDIVRNNKEVSIQKVKENLINYFAFWPKDVNKFVFFIWEFWWHKIFKILWFSHKFECIDWIFMSRKSKLEIETIFSLSFNHIISKRFLIEFDDRWDGLHGFFNHFSLIIIEARFLDTLFFIIQFLIFIFENLTVQLWFQLLNNWVLSKSAIHYIEKIF